MTDERTFTLHQIDQARTDFGIIEDQLEAIYARLTRTPPRVELARTALMLIGTELFWRQGV